MYRIVFTSTDPRTRLPVVEHGPWHATKELAEKWMAFFDERGVLSRMKIESATVRNQNGF